MGCHTSFSVPFLSGVEEIKKSAQEYLDKQQWMTDSRIKMYQYAIDNELEDPCCELAANHVLTAVEWENWILYKRVTDASVDSYNKEHGTNYSRYSKDMQPFLEAYSDEPRITGYPDRVIHSYEEMVMFMNTGFVDEKGEQHNFYWQPERYDFIMEGINRFFNKHPDGIITFG